MAPSIVVAGQAFSEKYQRCRHAVETVKAWRQEFVYETKGFLPTEYQQFLTAELKSLGVQKIHPEAVVGILVENGRKTYLGGQNEILDWLEHGYGYKRDYRDEPNYEELANQEFEHYCRSSGRQFCEIYLARDGTELGKLVIELMTDVCPKTSDNFIELLSGTGKKRYCYKDCPIHRVVKGGYIQTGDVVDGSGAGDPGFLFPDESFAVKHDQPGIVAMANLGEPHTNATQFYITLAPVPWLDGKKVAFGRVIEGMEVLAEVERSELSNERPYPEVMITKCKLLN